MFGLDLTFEMLHQAKSQLEKTFNNLPVKLVCASAHEMPFRASVFDVATCCLATHHMNAEKLLANTFAALKPGGRLYFGDVGGSARWKIFFIRGFLKLAAFLYFLFTENLSRARAESSAVSNVRSANEWLELMHDAGFTNIGVREMEMNRFWIPNPVIIEAQKPQEAL
jgi:ubiquinone/menaquinone biosynthesis C-methylase UbiE